MSTSILTVSTLHCDGDCPHPFCNVMRAKLALAAEIVDLRDRLATAEALALTNGAEAEQGRRNEASIKGQLRVVATAYFGPLGDLTAEQYLAKLENGLASAMQRQQESYERAEQIDAALAAANSLALTNGEARGRAEATARAVAAISPENDITEGGLLCRCCLKLIGDCDNLRALAAAEAERDELRGLVQRAAFWPAGHERCGVCYKTLRVCGLDNCCVGIGFRAWLAAHPAIPEGTPTDPRERCPRCQRPRRVASNGSCCWNTGGPYCFPRAPEGTRGEGKGP